MIQAEGITRKYGDFTAVDKISFSISRGQIVGLLGHNGAGKSTILKMLTTYLEPNEGTVFLDEIDIRKDPLLATNRIGYLPENCPLYTDMTVIDYLRYIAQLRGVDKNEELTTIQKAIEKTGLETKATSQISILSKGYRQRVGIAQAILHSPDILVLDEPTSGLDPSQIHEIRELIQELSQHATIILSTHILQEVEAICNRVIIIMQGKIVEDSTLEELTSSNRLILLVQENKDEVSQLIKRLKNVSISDVSQDNGVKCYVLDVEQDVYALSPIIAEQITNSGNKLLELYVEQGDLETVFRELSIHGGNK